MAKTKTSSAPKLKSLPPTADAFAEHVYCAHFQTMIWKASLSSKLPGADPVHYGWTKKEDNSLFPVMLLDDVSPAPVEVLQMIKCGCAAAHSCSTARCSCVITQMS